MLVLDGDTIKTRDDEMVRLLGINAPEIAHPGHGKFEGEHFGREAHEFLRKMIEGESVTLIIPEPESRDAFGRYLAIIELGSEVRFESGAICVNIELLQSGLAHLLFMGDGAILNEQCWIKVQAEARRNHRGIWTLPSSMLPALAFDTRNQARQLNM